MYFDSLQQLIFMDGHGIYVWSALVISLAVLAGGFYSIPLVKGIKEGIDSGDFFESVAASLESPTTALDGGEYCTQNLARLPCMPRLFPCL